MKAIVIGARTARQGTGPFIAAALAAQGVNVSAVVGTSKETVAAARETLLEDWQIDCAGYTGLEQALVEEQPDAVALCSPWRFHAEQLPAIAKAGCHCLVEKPMAWPANESEFDQLIESFECRDLFLQVVAQWPATLPGFYQLHDKSERTPARFSMRLSPISIGPDMVTDSAPHFVSMLQALLGPGDCENVRLTSDSEIPSRMDVHCDYRHLQGVTQATLHLETCEQRPRPAWYSIDTKRADREVSLPDYQQFLVSGEQRVALPDPIHQVVADFTNSIAEDAATEGELLRRSHRNLLQLASVMDGQCK